MGNLRLFQACSLFSKMDIPFSLRYALSLPKAKGKSVFLLLSSHIRENSENVRNEQTVFQDVSIHGYIYDPTPAIETLVG